jgi:hypothetical protein
MYEHKQVKNTNSRWSGNVSLFIYIHFNFIHSTCERLPAGNFLLSVVFVCVVSTLISCVKILNYEEGRKYV